MRRALYPAPSPAEASRHRQRTRVVFPEPHDPRRRRSRPRARARRAFGRRDHGRSLRIPGDGNRRRRPGRGRRRRRANASRSVGSRRWRRFQPARRSSTCGRSPGIPGLIDAHTHMTFYWDRSPGTPPVDAARHALARRHGVSRAGERRARRSRRASRRSATSAPGSTWTSRCATSIQPRRDGRAADVRRRLRPLRSRARPASRAACLEPGEANGVAEVLRVAREQIARRRRLDQDVRLDRQRPGRHRLPDVHLRGDEGGGRRRAPGRQADRHPLLRAGRRARRACARAPTPSSTRPTWTTRRSQRWRKRGTVYVPTVDHNRYYIAHKDEFGYDQEVVDRLNDYIRRNFETLKQAVQGRREDRHGLRRGLHRLRREHARARMVRQGRHDARARRSPPRRPTARRCSA